MADDVVVVFVAKYGVTGCDEVLLSKNPVSEPRFGIGVGVRIEVYNYKLRDLRLTT